MTGPSWRNIYELNDQQIKDLGLAEDHMEQAEPVERQPEPEVRHHARLREVVLQLVVGVVDEQLLEAVGGEDLRPEDIEQPDEQLAAVTVARAGRGGGGGLGSGLGLGAERAVHLAQQPAARGACVCYTARKRSRAQVIARAYTRVRVCICIYE